MEHPQRPEDRFETITATLLKIGVQIKFLELWFPILVQDAVFSYTLIIVNLKKDLLISSFFASGVLGAEETLKRVMQSPPAVVIEVLHFGACEKQKKKKLSVDNLIFANEI